MQIQLDLASFWNVIILVSVMGAGVFTFLRHNQKTYIDLIRQTSEGWQQAAQQKTQEVGELRSCVGDLQTQITKFKDEHAEVLRLNIKLQQEVSERDSRIQHLESQVGVLQMQVAGIQQSRLEKIA